MTRFLYAIVVVLSLMLAWKAWTVHQAWNFLDNQSLAQSYGAPPDKAKVTIVAFMNYASRPSKDINSTVMAVVESQPDTRIIFHIIPSQSLIGYRNAQIALAASLQNKFADMHDQLMRNEKPLSDQNIRDMAEKVKLDPDKLLKDMTTPWVKERMKEDFDALRVLRIHKTPQFVFNRKWIYGPDSVEGVYSDFNIMINKARGS